MGRSFSYVKYSFPDFGFAEIVVAYGIRQVHSRVKCITNRCGNIAKRCNSGRMPYAPTAVQFIG